MSNIRRGTWQLEHAAVSILRESFPGEPTDCPPYVPRVVRERQGLRKELRPRANELCTCCLQGGEDVPVLRRRAARRGVFGQGAAGGLELVHAVREVHVRGRLAVRGLAASGTRPGGEPGRLAPLSFFYSAARGTRQASTVVDPRSLLNTDRAAYNARTPMLALVAGGSRGFGFQGSGVRGTGLACASSFGAEMNHAAGLDESKRPSPARTTRGQGQLRTPWAAAGDGHHAALGRDRSPAALPRGYAGD